METIELVSEITCIKELSYLKLSRFASGLLSGLSMFEHKGNRYQSDERRESE